MDSGPIRPSQSRQPFYESNLFWGCGGLASAIVLTVVAAMIRDFRWLLLFAWPLFCVSIWAATKNISYMTTKVVVRISCWVIFAIALYALNIRLIPITDQPKQPPQLTGKQPEKGQQTPPPQAISARQASRQPREKQPREPARSEDRHEIKLTFKNSPLFTEKRKRLISHNINSFYKYLVDIGFDVQKQIPNIGTNRTYISVSGSDPVYRHSIFFKEENIDDPRHIAWGYARYAFDFNRLIGSREPQGALARNMKLNSIFADYYVSSYHNKLEILLGSNHWLEALWDIRSKYGKDFTDKMLLFTFRSIVDYPQMDKVNEFDIYFQGHLLSSEFVLENDIKTLKTHNDIIKTLVSHGLKSQE